MLKSLDRDALRAVARTRFTIAMVLVMSAAVFLLAYGGHTASAIVWGAVYVLLTVGSIYGAYRMEVGTRARTRELAAAQLARDIAAERRHVEHETVTRSWDAKHAAAREGRVIEHTPEAQAILARWAVERIERERAETRARRARIAAATSNS